MRQLGPIEVERSGHGVTVGVRRVGALQLARSSWGRARLARKLARAQKAANDPFWAPHVVPVRGTPTVLVSPWVDTGSGPSAAERAFLRRQLDRVGAPPEEPTTDLLDWEELRPDWADVGVEDHVLDAFEGALRDLRLPVTSTHGDLHSGNMGVTSGGRVGIIDWEMYTPRGSYLFDVVNYELHALCRDTGGRWEAMLPRLRHDPLVATAASAWRAPVPHLLLGYVVHRLGRQTWLLGGTHRGSAEKLDRHAATLRSAVHALA